MPLNSASTINIDLSSVPPPRLTHGTRTRPSLSSLGSMSSPASSAPSTPSSPDKLQMRQLKLSDEDSAVGSWHEDGSHNSNESDVIVGTVKEVKEEKELPFCTRVALYKRGELTVALQVSRASLYFLNIHRKINLFLLMGSFLHLILQTYSLLLKLYNHFDDGQKHFIHVVNMVAYSMKVK